jgi:hypothetical protein
VAAGRDAFVLCGGGGGFREAVASGAADGVSAGAGAGAVDVGPNRAGEDAGAGLLTELIGSVAGPSDGTSTVGGIAGRGCSDGGRAGGVCPGDHTPEARLNPTAAAHPTTATASEAHRVRSPPSSAIAGTRN